MPFYLQKISVVIIVNEDFQLLEFLQILLDLDFGRCQSLLQFNVVRVGDVQKLHAASTESLNTLDDVISPTKKLFYFSILTLKTLLTK